MLVDSPPLPLFFSCEKEQATTIFYYLSIILLYPTPPPPFLLPPSFASSRHSTQSHLFFFFHNIVTAFRRDNLDSFAGAVFSPFLPTFFPLFVRFFSSFRSCLCLPAVVSRLPFSLPAAHHVLQYRRAASGVTPVIRDGPDEAFIILSKRVSLSIRQHTVIIQSNG